jgi:hypothetical protein
MAVNILLFLHASSSTGSSSIAGESTGGGNLIDDEQPQFSSSPFSVRFMCVCVCV